MTSDDHQIIASVLSGETRAYAVLVDRYKDRALTLAVRLVGRREDAEELVQDAFVKAFNGLRTFRGDAKFSTWLHRIVYNLCMTKVSRRRKEMESTDLMQEQGRLPADPAGNGLDHYLEERERVELIERELRTMGEQVRAPIILFYLHDMKYEEIAEITGLPLGTVKTNLHRGRKLLRDRLGSTLKGAMVS